MPVVSIYTTDPQIWSRLAGMLAALGESAPEPIRTEAFSDFAAFLDSGKRNPRRILMLAQEGATMFTQHPSQLWIPAIAISLTMLAFNLLGDQLRDAFDPKLRR